MLTHGQIVRLIFGLKLRELRTEHHLTPAELAKACDVSVSYLNEIEKGKKYPKPDKILTMSRALDVSYDQLTSLTLSRRLAPIGELLQSDLLKEFPLAMFGLDAARIVELVSDAPVRINAFISAVLEIARNYELRQEHFYLAALRSYQELHLNYFEEMEQDVRTFIGQQQPTAPATVTAPFNLAQLTRTLTERYQYTIDREVLRDQPGLPKGLRAVFQPKPRRLLLRPGLTSAQEAFVLAREVAFNYLDLKERPYVNAPFPVRSFEEVLNYFKASYFAVALLLEEDALVRDLRQFFELPSWNPGALLDLLTRYNVSHEMFLQRLTNLLPRHFGLSNLFFLRFDQASEGASYELTKELHLTQQHNPHGNELQEHYCRRWVSLRLIEEARQQPGKAVVGAQRSRYYGSPNEYLCLTLARAGGPTEPGVSVTIGLRCDEALHARVKFLEDPAIVHRIVNETCERCPIPDCLERAAPPTEIERQQRQFRFEAFVAGLISA